MANMALTTSVACHPAATSHVQLKNTDSTIVRKSAKYHPNIWGDYFINYSQEQMKLDSWSGRAVELKKKTKKMLWDTQGSKQEIYLIDEIQRLGLTYHFVEEIEEALQKLNNSHHTQNTGDSGDLQSMALKFRLLRQGGYYIPCELFSKFTDSSNKFIPSSSGSIRDLLSLYEAAFLSIPGEDMLDEAILFTKQHLTSVLPHLQPHLATHIRRTLDLPVYKGMPRLESRQFITFYQQENSRSNTLLDFAKLDFNILQSLHQNELKEVSLWWKRLDLPGKLPFARDRLVELFYWILTLYYEPHLSRSRVSSTKLICLASLTDDIYDIYGTLDELEHLTDAIYRWDLEAMAELPEWMKAYYHALLNTVQEIEDELAPGQLSYQIDYLKEAVKGFVRGNLQEARWCKAGHVPTLEEYFTASLYTAGYPVLPVAAILGMGEKVTRESLDWLISRPNFMRASALIARLMDDIVSHKFEQEREHVASSVECVMMEKGVSEEEAREELRKMVADAWKEVNKGLLRPFPHPLPILLPTLGLARTGELFYRHKDAYTNATGETKDNVVSLFIEPFHV